MTHYFFHYQSVNIWFTLYRCPESSYGYELEENVGSRISIEENTNVEEVRDSGTLSTLCLASAPPLDNESSAMSVFSYTSSYSEVSSDYESFQFTKSKEKPKALFSSKNAFKNV